MALEYNTKLPLYIACLHFDDSFVNSFLITMVFSTTFVPNDSFEMFEKIKLIHLVVNYHYDFFSGYDNENLPDNCVIHMLYLGDLKLII